MFFKLSAWEYETKSKALRNLRNNERQKQKKHEQKIRPIRNIAFSLKNPIVYISMGAVDQSSF